MRPEYQALKHFSKHLDISSQATPHPIAQQSLTTTPVLVKLASIEYGIPLPIDAKSTRLVCQVLPRYSTILPVLLTSARPMREPLTLPRPRPVRDDSFALAPANRQRPASNICDAPRTCMRVPQTRANPMPRHFPHPPHFTCITRSLLRIAPPPSHLRLCLRIYLSSPYWGCCWTTAPMSSYSSGCLSAAVIAKRGR